MSACVESERAELVARGIDQRRLARFERQQEFVLRGVERRAVYLGQQFCPASPDRLRRARSALRPNRRRAPRLFAGCVRPLRCDRSPRCDPRDRRARPVRCACRGSAPSASETCTVASPRGAFVRVLRHQLHVHERRLARRIEVLIGMHRVVPVQALRDRIERASAPHVWCGFAAVEPPADCDEKNQRRDRDDSVVVHASLVSHQIVEFDAALQRVVLQVEPGQQHVEPNAARFENLAERAAAGSPRRRRRFDADVRLRLDRRDRRRRVVALIRSRS